MGAQGPVVAIVATGVANTASVMAALRRAGAQPQIVSDPAAVASATHAVLPGVGAFGAGMASLRALGMVDVLRQRIADDQPTLAVCLGLQLLGATSEETPDVDGLGVVAASAQRFPSSHGLRVPQIGWNPVRVDGGQGLLTAGYAYFANSFRLTSPPLGWRCAMADHGGPFVAAMERGRVLACQFHPELSGVWGEALLARWLAGEQALDGVTNGPAAGLRPRVIPCLDVRNGRIVKGVRFQGLRDAGDPAEQAARYDADGADELVVLDVSATKEGRAAARDTVRKVRAELRIPLTVGGGVRTASDAAELLTAGADKVSINTAAVLRPELLSEIAEQFGRQCTVLAVDAARANTPDEPVRWEVVIKAGTERTGRDAIDWIRDGVARGAGEILLTSWDQDGTRSGYDTELLAAAAQAVSVPIIASGGADTTEHLEAALRAGADAVLAASIFHDGDTTPDVVKSALRARGVAVRLA